MDTKSFSIKEYGRTELALLYSPDLTPSAAWRKLRLWIETNTALSDELYLLGYNGSMRSFTPRMVARIVFYLGIP